MFSALASKQAFIFCNEKKSVLSHRESHPSNFPAAEAAVASGGDSGISLQTVND